MIGAARRAIARVLDIKSARGVSFALSILTLASKPLGFIRFVIMAWAFGTSAGVDSFHIANGIVGLFTGTAGQAVQKAVLPEMERAGAHDGEEACRAICSFVVWAIAIASAMICAAFAIGPGVIVRTFAGGFDAERIRVGAIMLWWLVPLALANMFRPVLEIWAMHTARYTLSAATALLFNVIAIPALLIGAPLIGEYAIALSVSAANASTAALFLIGLGGIPLAFKLSSLPRGCIGRIARNSVYAFVLSGLGALFMMVDRYFASLLPSGAVASIGYGGTIITLLAAAAMSPMLYFLTRISRSAGEDLDAARQVARDGISIVMAYFVPVGLFLAATSTSLTSLIYGWGEFGEESTRMTSTALMSYSLGLVFSLMNNVVNSFALAAQKYRAIVGMSIAGITLNTALDALLVERFGLLGLSAATSITQCIVFLIGCRAMMGWSPARFLAQARFLQQTAAAGALALLAHLASPLGSVAQLAISALLASAYLLAASRLRLMPLTPEHWTPIALARFFIRAALSYAGREKRS